MLEIRDIYKTFNPGTINEKRALRGVSLTLEDGDFVTVIGGNGAGKSTLLNAVAGVWQVDEGSIWIDGVDVTRLPEYKRAKYIGRVFQDPMMGTAADMWIEENMALSMRRGQRRARRVQAPARHAGSGSGRPHDQQSRPAVGRSASGAYAAYGLA